MAETSDFVFLLSIASLTEDLPGFKNLAGLPFRPVKLQLRHDRINRLESVAAAGNQGALPAAIEMILRNHDGKTGRAGLSGLLGQNRARSAMRYDAVAGSGVELF